MPERLTRFFKCFFGFHPPSDELHRGGPFRIKCENCKRIIYWGY